MIKTAIRTYEIKVAANSEGCLHENLKPVRGSEEIQVSFITNGQSFQDRCLGWGWGWVLLNALNRKRQVIFKSVLGMIVLIYSGLLNVNSRRNYSHYVASVRGHFLGYLQLCYSKFNVVPSVWKVWSLFYYWHINVSRNAHKGDGGWATVWDEEL